MAPTTCQITDREKPDAMGWPKATADANDDVLPLWFAKLPDNSQVQDSSQPTTNIMQALPGISNTLAPFDETTLDDTAAS